MEEGKGEVYHGNLLDINEPEYVQVEISHDGSVIWVHVDGISRLRICRIKHSVDIVDNRPVSKRKGAAEWIQEARKKLNG